MSRATKAGAGTWSPKSENTKHEGGGKMYSVLRTRDLYGSVVRLPCSEGYVPERRERMRMSNATGPERLADEMAWDGTI